MPSHDLETMEEAFLDQQELIIHNKQSSPEKINGKTRLLKTVALSMAFFCLGLCIAIPGPTLLDLGRRVSRDTEHMTFIFTARSVGFLVGSLVGGILFDFFDQQILLFYTLAVVAVATVGVPWCSALLTLSTFICMQGVALGVLDTGGNVFCIKIWGKRSSPFMQVLHFAFGIGAFLAPLIARPFLMDREVYNNTTMRDYHPVNHKMISLMSRSADNRFLRDLSRLHFVDRGYTFRATLSSDNLISGTALHISKNNTERHKISTLLPGFFPPRYENYFSTDKSQKKKRHSDALSSGGNLKRLIILRAKRQDSKGNYTISTSDLGNDSQLMDFTSTPKPSPTIERPKKPAYNKGEDLSEIHADAASVDSKLKDLINKPPLDNVEVEKAAPGTIAVGGHDLNVTNGGDNVTNILQDGNNTGKFYVSSTLPAATTSTTLATTTTATSSSTASTSTTLPTTSTPTTTIATTTESTKAAFTTSVLILETSQTQDTVTTSYTTNRSTVTKPETTGDLLKDMITTLTRMSRIQFAYSVIGLLLALNAGLFLFLHCKDKLLKSPLYTRRYRDPNRNPYTKCYVASVVLLLFFFFLAYMGLEATFGGLLTTFAVYYPSDPWTPAQGATLTALFWGCLAFGRGCSIFIARCVKPSSMMIMNLCLTVFGTTILCFGVPSSSVMLWVGTVTLGLGMSSLFPTAISWADSCYPLSGKATAVFVAGCGVGEMSVPALTGYLYENISHMAVMYITLFLSCLLSTLYLSMQLLVYRKGKTSQRRVHTGFERLKEEEDEVDESDLGIIEGITLGVMETTWRRGAGRCVEKTVEVTGSQQSLLSYL